ncbi:hypothetical protein [Brasilonema sp. UFV-L1]|uniref:hypothetical protein n=1 Tax=Brasilonema sp. UFV-L1 TaxID=2234130 RepID=UPI00145DAC48|nr:hypothetical protein [Brasilonema sp. UFV-L1]
MTAYPPTHQTSYQRIEAGIKGGNPEPNRESLQARVHGYEQEDVTESSLTVIA